MLQTLFRAELYRTSHECAWIFTLDLFASDIMGFVVINAFFFHDLTDTFVRVLCIKCARSTTTEVCHALKFITKPFSNTRRETIWLVHWTVRPVLYGFLMVITKQHSIELRSTLSTNKTTTNFTGNGSDTWSNCSTSQSTSDPTTK